MTPPVINMTPFKAAFPLIFSGESWVSLSVGLGWRPILWNLCEGLEALARDAWPDGTTPIQILQIKEKMAVLVVQAFPRTDAVNALIQDALDQSASTCEWCGAPGARIRSVGGWMKATCEVHFNQRLAAPHVRWRDEPDETWDQPGEGR